MTGPEHYRMAEQLLANTVVESLSDANCDHHEHAEEDLAAGVPSAYLLAAQVHATLALAAATAEPIALSYDGNYDTSIPRAWSEATS